MTSAKNRVGGFVLAAFLVVLTACSKAPEPAEPVAEGPGSTPVGRLSDAVVPVHYRLELRVNPRDDAFGGTTSIDVEVARETGYIWLHGKGLEVSEAFVVDSSGNRINATYEQRDDSGVALVTLDAPVPAGAATINLTYTASFNEASYGLFKAVRGENSYIASQMQPIGARLTFPGFDEPAFKVPFDLSLVTLADDVAVTTTPETNVETLDDGFVRRTFATTPPLPTYLLAFAVGPYEVVDYGEIPPNAIRDRGVQLRGIVAQGQAERVKYALEHTDGLLTVLEEYFGTPYPYRKLDLIAVPESFGGAMENPGAIVYDEFLLLMDDMSPLQQRRMYTAVHAHELAHMWFGNLVTPEWWNDIWLNESFASWIMFKAADAYWPDGEFDRQVLSDALGAMQGDSLASTRQIREPVKHNNEIANAFDGITYQKGGGVLKMLERYVGEEEFQQGIQLHMSRYAESTATAEKFIASVAEGSDRTEIEVAFRSFIGQPGVPLLSVSLDCESGQEPQLTVSQQRYAPLGSTIDASTGEWQIPMCISYTTDSSTGSDCTFIASQTETVPISAESCPTWVHPNADGAGYYRFTLDDAGWQALVDNVTDLPASEALAFADSLDAALRAGAVSAENYVNGMAALLEHDAWDVVDSVTNYFEAITDVVEHTKLDTVEAGFRTLLSPIFDNLGDSTESGDALLRQRLLRFMIVMAKDQEMRAPLAEKAAARIGLDGDPDPTAVDQSELETVLSIGVQDIGEPFFNLLLEQAIASDDPTFRGSAIGALARVEDPELVAKLQEAVVADQFKGAEIFRVIARQMVRAATTEPTYQWIRNDPDAVFSKIPETFRSDFAAGLGGSFCTAEKADEWEAFIKSRADDLPGYERSLTQATERARLCAGLRENSEQALLEAFAAIQ